MRCVSALLHWSYQGARWSNVAPPVTHGEVFGRWGSALLGTPGLQRQMSMWVGSRDHNARSLIAETEVVRRYGVAAPRTPTGPGYGRSPSPHGQRIELVDG